MRRIARRSLTGTLIALTLAACIPSQATSRLNTAPGNPVVVSSDTYDAGLFRARYPAGWRVITSPAGEPPFVTFVAPDNCALILLSARPRPAPPLGADCAEPGNTRELSAEAGEERGIYAAGRAAESVSASFLATWRRVISSVTTP